MREPRPARADRRRSSAGRPAAAGWRWRARARSPPSAPTRVISSRARSERLSRHNSVSLSSLSAAPKRSSMPAASRRARSASRSESPSPRRGPAETPASSALPAAPSAAMTSGAVRSAAGPSTSAANCAASTSPSATTMTGRVVATGTSRPLSGRDRGTADDSLRRYEPDQVPRVCGPCRTLSARWRSPVPFFDCAVKSYTQSQARPMLDSASVPDLAHPARLRVDRSRRKAGRHHRGRNLRRVHAYGPGSRRCHRRATRPDREEPRIRGARRTRPRMTTGHGGDRGARTRHRPGRHRQARLGHRTRAPAPGQRQGGHSRDGLRPSEASRRSRTVNDVGGHGPRTGWLSRSLGCGRHPERLSSPSPRSRSR